MDRELLQQLTSRDTLLAVGVTLFVLGLILRGLARDHRRTLARRKQHKLDTRRAGTPLAEVSLSHLEKHFARYANGVFVLGIIVAAIALFR
jgi:predicted PurR-regulated permease PerM